MENCTITKLIGNVVNNNLPIYNAFVFDVVYNNAGNINNKIYFSIYKDAPIAPVIKALSGSFLIDGVEYTEYTMTKPYNNLYYVPNGIELKNENCKIAILNAKYYLESINYMIGYNSETAYNNIVKFDISQLDYAKINSIIFPITHELYGTLALKDSSKITNINVRGTTKKKLYLNLNQFARTSKITNFQVGYSFAEGDIINLANNIELSNMNISNSNISGSVEVFAAAMVAAGRTSGKLTLTGANSLVTYTGYPVKANYKITFNSSIENGYEITTT